GLPRRGGDPNTFSEPPIGACNPKSRRKRVVFPAPFGPMIATNSPRPSDNFPPLQTVFSQYPAARLSAATSLDSTSTAAFFEPINNSSFICRALGHSTHSAGKLVQSLAKIGKFHR